jgi:hypothetical protein
MGHTLENNMTVAARQSKGPLMNGPLDCFVAALPFIDFSIEWHFVPFIYMPMNGTLYRLYMPMNGTLYRLYMPMNGTLSSQ